VRTRMTRKKSETHTKPHRGVINLASGIARGNEWERIERAESPTLTDVSRQCLEKRATDETGENGSTRKQGRSPDEQEGKRPDAVVLKPKAVAFALIHTNT